jgi:WAS/WASL-interacting protein
MAENVPNPPAGAVPTKKTTGRVQPKKETVRINLPPKPSAAPTIKLPTLPPGGTAGSPGAPSAPPPAPKPATAAPPAPGAAPRATGAPTAQRPPPTQQQQRPAPPQSKPALSTVDLILAIAAAVAGLAAIGTTAYLIWFLPTT